PVRTRGPAQRSEYAIPRGDAVSVARAWCHGELLAGEGDAGVGVVAALEGDAAFAAAARGHLIHLRPAAAIGGEIHRVAVRAPRRRSIDAEVVGEPGQRLAAQVHDVDL